MGLKEIFLVFCALGISFSVDPNNFKICEQSSFCRRCRQVQPGNSQFSMVPGSLYSYSDSITAEIINKENDHLFVFKLEALEGNTFRIQIDEKSPLKPRYRVTDSLKGNPKTTILRINDQSGTNLEVISGPNKAIIHATPFSIDFYQNDVLSVSVNAKGLMRFEHLRTRIQAQVPEPEVQNENNEGVDENQEVDGSTAAPPPPPPPPVQKSIEDEDPGAWEENFKSHHDSKPNGPEAVALDFSFPQAQVLFGIPEHADSFSLKPTIGNDPYRLYNLDVFEYELNSRMALYGSVPVLYGHGPDRTTGVFWNNAAETWVDINNPNLENNVMSSIVNFVAGSRKTDPPSAHFMSESGIIDVFIMLGPTPLEAFRQYTDLTGTANLPQLFALGYHQCRWNYNDEQDVETVSRKFDEHDIPMDTMWLDIEYTEGKKYFTWDTHKFPHPLEMIKNLTDLGRHLTIIIDPHIKREPGYFFHEDCTNRGYYTKTKDNKNDYEGWCWPGSASYPDLFNPEVRKYFADQYLLENFKTTTADVMIWNDMNEPSVFNGPEVTMLKDNMHFGDWEHRDVHNLYGHMQLMATFDGLSRRDPNQRPFILTRSHFAGSQRLATIWTGDNKADWGHLAASIQICLSEAVAGFSFCGSDVGGFFGNPDSELFYRWYQAGAFQPFFRSHAHIDTKRREPWLFPDVKLIIRDAIRKRYSYLPLWYTMFYEHERYGLPVMRPLLTHYPQDKEAFTIDYEYLLQDRLLVRPVLHQGASAVDVYFPINNNKQSDLWYDIDNYERYDKTGVVSVPVDNYKIPVYQRGGTIIPKKERIRRAATLMINDPYTLVICVDSNGYAKGTLFIDDEKSYQYRKGHYSYIEFEFKKNTLENRFIDKNTKFTTKSWLERVIIAGLDKVPTSAKLITDGDAQELEVLTKEKAVVIRKPGIKMLDNFKIKLKY